MTRIVGSSAALIAIVVATVVGAQERKMDVKQAPDAVFTEPVASLLPELAGATATGQNGRVGNELVFWGYKLGNGRPAFLFACMPKADVNCDERVPMICTARTNVLTTGSANGNIVRRQCRELTVAQIGDVRPGCVDTLENVPLSIGLVSCGGG
jgi:hypothetical protein